MKREVLGVFFFSVAAGACSGGASIVGQTADGGGYDAGEANDGTSPSVDSSDGSSLPIDGDLPCAVQALLAARCVGCHAADPLFGAPMPLLRRGDFLAMATSDPTQRVADLVPQRIRDERKPMPPSPRPRLSAVEVDVLLEWLYAGLPERQGSCDPPDDAAVDGGPVDSTDGGGPEDTGPPLDCDHRIEILAHGETPGSPFIVPQEDDRYQCFYFKVPWGTTPAHALRFSPIVDDARVLHHWLLYEETNDTFVDGSQATCSGLHGAASLLVGWAPGGQAAEMPPDVGLRMPRGEDAFFILEIHYNNARRLTDAADRSGVELCATTDLRPKEAAPHWLGSERIFLRPGDGEAGTTCNPELTEPAHIIAVTPHMHQLGTRMRTIIHRAGGGDEVLHDEPFEFENQVSYPKEVVINPGDSLTTTCFFTNTTGGLVTFGTGTDQEMCYNFVTAYPVGSFNTGGGFAPGANRCMQ